MTKARHPAVYALIRASERTLGSSWGRAGVAGVTLGVHPPDRLRGWVDDRDVVRYGHPMTRTRKQPAKHTLGGAPMDQLSTHRHYSLLFSISEDDVVHAVVGRMDPTTKQYTFIRLDDFTVDLDTGAHVSCITSALSTQMHQDREASQW